MFMSELRPDVENPTFDVLSVLGGTNDGDGTNEAVSHSHRPIDHLLKSRTDHGYPVYRRARY